MTNRCNDRRMTKFISSLF